MKRRYLRAQTALEYAVIIGVFTAALIAMQVYVKRAYQGGMRNTWDSLGEQYNPAHTTGSSSTGLKMEISSSSVKGLSTFEINQEQSRNLTEQVIRTAE